jgi:hypothetical protein
MPAKSVSIMRGRPHRWTLWGPIVIAWLLVGIALPVSPGWAQTDVTGAVDVAGILVELGDDDYSVRQAATRRLLADDNIPARDLDRMYAASQTPEQRHRLLRVLRHHLIRRMIADRFGDQAGPGSMGLSHHVVRVTGPDGATERTGVMVVMTLPGFPAYALLEPGDVIVDFADQPIPERMSPAQFQQLIRTHQAGERIGLTVMRNGKPVRVLFVLCQGQALTEVYDTGGITLKEPYGRAWWVERGRVDDLLVDDAGAEGGVIDHAAPVSE